MIEDNQVDELVVLGRGDKLSIFKETFSLYVAYTLNPVDANYDQIICDAYGASCLVPWNICVSGAHQHWLYRRPGKWYTVRMRTV